VALGQAPSVGTQNEWHVSVTGHLEIEQPGEQDLTRRRVQEVHPSHHLAHVLGRIVYHDGELVGGGAVVAANDEVIHLPFVVPE